MNLLVYCLDCHQLCSEFKVILMIPYSKQSITDKDIDEVVRVLKSDFLTQGPCVPQFEKALEDKFGVQHAVVCSSGTAALHLAYAGLGVGPGSIGVVPAITFSATANAFLYLGAEIRFCDVDQSTGLICCDSLEHLLKSIKHHSDLKSVVVSPVSFAGATAPLDQVYEIAQKYGIQVVEDASHSPGSYCETARHLIKSATCEFSEAACLSFHPVKHICCGEGGAVLTNRDDIAKSVRSLRSHGIERPYDENHESPWFYQQHELGWNYRLTDLQAALGRSQLAGLDAQLSKRRRLATRYDHALSHPPFTHLLDRPLISLGHAWHLYIIRFKEKGMRDRAHKFLKEKGIITQVHYVPVHKHPYYEKRIGSISLPGAEKFYESCLSIPMFPALTDEDQNQVVNELRAFCESF